MDHIKNRFLVHLLSLKHVDSLLSINPAAFKNFHRSSSGMSTSSPSRLATKQRIAAMRGVEPVSSQTAPFSMRVAMHEMRAGDQHRSILSRSMSVPPWAQLVDGSNFHEDNEGYL
jgi:hypothetical protein